MVEEIRNKWCDDLEDLLQCPICMIRPKNWIYQCIQGHHICEDCKIQLVTCPTCTQNWSTARNRLAEHLCLKLDEIKLSLIDPENEINKLLIPDRVSVASQTEGELGVAAAAPPVKKPNDGHTGPYPCRIDRCTTNRYYEPLLKHFETDHPTQFVELPNESTIFQHVWTFEFIEQMTFDRAFLIAEMGTFFLKLSSDVFGNFTGFILMVHNGFIAKQYTYQLEISCCKDHVCSSYKGEVNSCRTPATVLRDKSLQIKRTDIQKMIEHEKILTCTLLLGKKPQSEQEHEQSKASGDIKKKNPKSRAHQPRPPYQNGQKIPPLTAGPSNYQPNFNRVPPLNPNGLPRANRGLTNRVSSIPNISNDDGYQFI